MKELANASWRKSLQSSQVKSLTRERERERERGLARILDLNESN